MVKFHKTSIHDLIGASDSYSHQDSPVSRETYLLWAVHDIYQLLDKRRDICRRKYAVAVHVGTAKGEELGPGAGGLIDECIDKHTNVGCVELAVAGEIAMVAFAEVGNAIGIAVGYDAVT